MLQKVNSWKKQTKKGPLFFSFFLFFSRFGLICTHFHHVFTSCFLIIASLRCNLHTTEFPFVNHTVQSVLVYSQSWSTLIANFRAFHHSKRDLPSHRPLFSIFSPQLLKTWIYFLLICLLDISYILILQYVVFCNCLNSHRSVNALCNKSLYFIPFSGWVILYPTSIHILFIRSSMIRYQGCFHFFWPLWITLIWTFVYKFLCGHIILFLFSVYLRIELLSHMITLHLTFWEIDKSSSK